MILIIRIAFIVCFLTILPSYAYPNVSCTVEIKLSDGLIGKEHEKTYVCTSESNEELTQVTEEVESQIKRESDHRYYQGHDAAVRAVKGLGFIGAILLVILFFSEIYSSKKELVRRNK